MNYSKGLWNFSKEWLSFFYALRFLIKRKSTHKDIKFVDFFSKTIETGYVTN